MSPRALVAVALALATGCGTRLVALGPAGLPAAAPNSLAPAGSGAVAAPRSTIAPDRPNPFAGSEPTGRLKGPVQQGTLRIAVTITPACVTRGQAALARTTSAPGAAVAFAVAYADGQTYGQFGTGRALPDGSFSYAWTVPPVARYGQAKFLFGASDEVGKRSGAGIWPFEVAPPGRCPTGPTSSSA